MTIESERGDSALLFSPMRAQIAAQLTSAMPKVWHISAADLAVLRLEFTNDELACESSGRLRILDTLIEAYPGDDIVSEGGEMRDDETIMEMLCRVVRPLVSDEDRDEIDEYLARQALNRVAMNRRMRDRRKEPA